MLVTQSTLVKVICFVVPVFVVSNFLYLSLVSLPSQTQADIKQSIHQVFHHNWTASTSNSTISLSPELPQSDYYAARKPIPAYVDAPSILDQLFSSPNPDRMDFHEWNAKTLRDLHACMTLDNCGPNQLKVALLADDWIQAAVVRDFRGGEGIW
jgi:hypothetical protein